MIEQVPPPPVPSTLSHAVGGVTAQSAPRSTAVSPQSRRVATLAVIIAVLVLATGIAFSVLLAPMLPDPTPVRLTSRYASPNPIWVPLGWAVVIAVGGAGALILATSVGVVLTRRRRAMGIRFSAVAAVCGAIYIGAVAGNGIAPLVATRPLAESGIPVGAMLLFGATTITLVYFLGRGFRSWERGA